MRRSEGQESGARSQESRVEGWLAMEQCLPSHTDDIMRQLPPTQGRRGQDWLVSPRRRILPILRAFNLRALVDTGLDQVVSWVAWSSERARMAQTTERDQTKDLIVRSPVLCLLEHTALYRVRETSSMGRC